MVSSPLGDGEIEKQKHYLPPQVLLVGNGMGIMGDPAK